MPATDPAASADGPPQVYLTRLKLTDFRNYRALDLGLAPGPIVVTGENGAGKTNILEAISFLTPGRGLRRASHDEIARTGAGDGFAVHAAVDGPAGSCEIGTGTLGSGGESGRKVRINGAQARSAEDMLEWLRVIWLTPAMDALFTGPAGDRRRFLDRLVLAIDPAHGARAIDYERAMRGRNRLLADDTRDEKWFEAIEVQIAESGVAIAAARVELVRLLRSMVEKSPSESPFPQADISLSGKLEAQIGALPAVDIEEAFRRTLAESRGRDRAAGRTLEGPHRSDLLVRHRPKDMPAELCSTGEQKALLVGIILSHARLTGELSGMAPILLLDELAAHIDPGRRAALFEILHDLNCQVFMTGTEPAPFSSLQGSATFFTVSEGTVRPGDQT